MKKTIALLAFLCSIKCFSQPNAQSAKDDIRKVVSTYFNSILNKDSVTFCNLFALDSISFYGVAAPDSYQAYARKGNELGDRNLATNIQRERMENNERTILRQ
jgi:hypothetical protein